MPTEIVATAQATLWNPTPTGARRRLGFLDVSRAIAVLAMLCANLVNVFLRRVPSPLAHNQGDALRVFDLPAPVFQFLLGVSLVLFLEKRAARGLSALETQLAALRRFVLLIALGCVLDGIGTLKSAPQWGVLQTLGLGGAVATGVAYLPDAYPAGLALALLGAFSGLANGDVHHSPFAAFAFVPLTLAGLLVGRGLRAGAPRREFVARAAIVTATSGVLALLEYLFGVPFNKVLGTGSFVALATTVAVALMVAVERLERARVAFPPWLVAVGANALTAWVLQYVLVYYPAWLLFPTWHRLPLVPGIASVVAVATALATVTVVLGRRGIRIPI